MGSLSLACDSVGFTLDGVTCAHVRSLLWNLSLRPLPWLALRSGAAGLAAKIAARKKPLDHRPSGFSFGAQERTRTSTELPAST